MSVRIIVDSTADVTPEVKERLLTVPMTVHFGEEEYIDGVTITHRQFYEKLVECETLPSTSQATPSNFARIYRQVAEAGDTAVVLTLSSKLSGTYQSAVIAAEEYSDIYVVDSLSVAIGSGILAELALKLVDDGLCAAAIYDRLMEERNNVRLIALLDTLEYLKRGGRISKTVALAGGLLSIKPAICLDGGEVQMLGKARGSKQGNNLLVAEIEKAGGVDFDKPLLLGYTGLTDILLQKYIEDSAALWQNGTETLRTAVIGSTIGTHVGPGAIAAAFFSKHAR